VYDIKHEERDSAEGKTNQKRSGCIHENLQIMVAELRLHIIANHSLFVKLIKNQKTRKKMTQRLRQQKKIIIIFIVFILIFC